MSASRVLSVSDWNPSAVRYMQPRVNDRGGKGITIISNQTGRSLHISTPLLMTWGVSDYTDEKTGESDGKFTMSLNFPNADYSNKQSEAFLEKLKEFEEHIIDDAVKHTEAWFGKERSREVIKDSFFPFIKYPRDKLTKKLDHSKAPNIRVKVPNYGGEWKNLEIYDTKQQLLFPSDNENLTPIDLVPKKSQVACVIQCGGIWTAGGNSWGVIWKLNQCVVKPPTDVSIFGKCNVMLSESEIETLETQPEADPAVVNEDEVEVFESTSSDKKDTAVEDSDEEEEPAPAPAPAPKKKVVKKAAPPPEDDADEEPAPTPKKKVVKKKASA